MVDSLVVLPHSGAKVTSKEAKDMIAGMPQLTPKDVLFAHLLVGVIGALENIREEMVIRKWGSDGEN